MLTENDIKGYIYWFRFVNNANINISGNIFITLLFISNKIILIGVNKSRKRRRLFVDVYLFVSTINLLFFFRSREIQP